MTEKTSKKRKYSPTFWVANIIELFERWGWYGAFMIFALYFTGSRDTGALGLSQTEKGLILGIGTAILYFLPVLTGAIADKVGYKKVLVFSFILYAVGFVAIGEVDSFFMVFAVYLLIAVASAFFKPIPAATITKTTTKETSSIGFGIYYMMVNIGAVIGPVTAAKLRPHAMADEAGNLLKDASGALVMDSGNWNYVFWMSAIIMVAGLILVLIFYKEPDREIKKESLGQTIAEIFKNLATSLKDFKLLIFLLLIVGFWSSYYQLFYTLPIFIDQWVDTTILYRSLESIAPWLASMIGTENGTISAEMLTTLPAMYIVIFQIAISALVMKWRPINAMITGILVNTIGLALCFLTQNPIYLAISILVFALGEMSSSPKITEYLGRIAPKDKRALYIGCSFIPIAGGSFFAGMLSSVYEGMSDKITLLQREVASRGLEIEKISEQFTQNDYIRKAGELMDMSPQEITNFLWTKYSPSDFWIIIAAIGLSTVLLLLLYDRFILKS